MAPAPVPPPLTEDQIAEFYREGYFVARGLVPATSIDKLLKEVKLPEWVKDGGNWSPIIFDRSTLHRSLKNDTDENRYAYAAQYQADNAREAATGRKDPTRMLASELRSQLLPLLD